MLSNKNLNKINTWNMCFIEMINFFSKNNFSNILGDIDYG